MIRIRCKYNFFDALGLDANEQLADLQLIGAYPVNGADGTEQNVVAALEVPGAFDGDDITSFLHHAHDGRVATIVHADATQIAFGDVPTATAERNSSLGVGDGMSKAAGILRWQFEEMECNALGRLRANAGKAAEFVNQRLNGEGVVGGHRRLVLLVQEFSPGEGFDQFVHPGAGVLRWCVNQFGWVVHLVLIRCGIAGGSPTAINLGLVGDQFERDRTTEMTSQRGLHFCPILLALRKRRGRGKGIHCAALLAVDESSGRINCLG